MTANAYAKVIPGRLQFKGTIHKKNAKKVIFGAAPVIVAGKGPMHTPCEMRRLQVMMGRYLHNVQDGHVKPYRAQVNDFNTYLSM